MGGSQAQPQDLVVTLLGTYVHQRTQAVWSGGLVRLLGELGFSVAASRVALSRLVARRLLTRERAGRLAHYRLTPRCIALLDEGDARIFALGRRHNDGDCWTVLWHAIPDDRKLERSRLARRLRFLGFGSLQDGTWIAARDREADVVALLDDLAVRKYAAVMVGRPAASVDFAGVVARAWDLRGLDVRYRHFVRTFAPYARDGATRSVSDRDAFSRRTRLVSAYRAFPALDPELPGSVASEPKHRDDAVALFHRLYGRLAAPAQRYFDSVALA